MAPTELSHNHKWSFRDREQIWDTIRIYYETWVVNNIIGHRASLENAMTYFLSHHNKWHTKKTIVTPILVAQIV